MLKSTIMLQICRKVIKNIGFFFDISAFSNKLHARSSFFSFETAGSTGWYAIM